MIAAVLETMWGDPGSAPRWFRINPHNFTGRRLCYLTNQDIVWCTNVCRECVSDARQHGTPDPVWLSENLKGFNNRLAVQKGRLQPITLLLVCGEVAKRAYFNCDYCPDFTVMFLPHPAARNWTKEKLKEWRENIVGKES